VLSISCAAGQSAPVISRSVVLRSLSPGYDSLALGKPRCGVCRYQLSRDFPSPFPGRFSHLPALRMQCIGGRDGLALATMVASKSSAYRATGAPQATKSPARRKRSDGLKRTRTTASLARLSTVFGEQGFHQ
jgi:hypothetical protein